MKAYVLQEVVDTISRNLGGNGVRQLEGSHEEVLLQAIEDRHGTEHDRGVQGLLHEDRLVLSPMNGKFHTSAIRLGSRGDSYYEYLM